MNKLLFYSHLMLHSKYKILISIFIISCFYSLFYKQGLLFCMVSEIGTEEELLQINKELLESNLKYAEKLKCYQRMVIQDLLKIGEFNTRIEQLESENIKLREELYKLSQENSKLAFSKELLQNEIGSLKRNLIQTEKEPCVSVAPSDIIEPIKKRTRK